MAERQQQQDRDRDKKSRRPFRKSDFEAVLKSATKLKLVGFSKFSNTVEGIALLKTGFIKVGKDRLASIIGT